MTRSNSHKICEAPTPIVRGAILGCPPPRQARTDGVAARCCRTSTNGRSVLGRLRKSHLIKDGGALTLSRKVSASTMATPSLSDPTIEDICKAIENNLKGTAPSNWWLHASWCDQTLVVFVSPPTQESFDLWYDMPGQKETLENLCKAIPVSIWNQI
jgi:hypothetical protein